MSLLKLTKEKFEEAALPYINKRNAKIVSRFEEEYEKDTVAEILNGNLYSFTDLMRETNFQECTVDEKFLNDMLDDMKFSYYRYGTGEPESLDVNIEYPSVDFNEIKDLDELNYEIYNEVMTSNYCTAWFFDELQGSGFQKSYDLVVNQNYYLYQTVEDYEEDRDEAIDQHIKNRELDDENEMENLKDQCLSQTEQHAIYLSNGSVVYIHMPVEESIEHL